MFKIVISLSALVSLVAVTSSTYAQSHSNNGSSSHHTGTKMYNHPQQFGQSAFAAIAEIVVILKQNPATDWSRVNIDALREHLVHMNDLTLRSVVVAKSSTDGMTFQVTGHGRVADAIKAMVPAHAHFLSKSPEFNANTQIIPDGVLFTVSSTNKETIKQIKGLGFFGVMALGVHHQRHHLAMAKGHPMH